MAYADMIVNEDAVPSTETLTRERASTRNAELEAKHAPSLQNYRPPFEAPSLTVPNSALERVFYKRFNENLAPYISPVQHSR